MKLESLLQVGTLCSFLIAGASVAIALVSHHRQINASIYLDLTSRLQKLYQAIPTETRATCFGGGEMPVAQVAVIDFLNLLNSAFTLHRSGYFSGALWKALESEVKYGLRLPLFRAHWPNLKQNLISNPAFVRYIDQIQNDATP